MPTTVATALVLLIAIVPGAAGSFFYRALNGIDWREREWNAAIRFVAFSIVGLSLYVIPAAWFGWPPASHVIPGTYTSPDFSAERLPVLFAPYLGHLLGAAVVGSVAAGAVRLVSRVVSTTPQPCAWDAFVRNSMPSRWIVVTLKSGDVYAGYATTADEGVPASDRDVILAEPAAYDPAKRKYFSTPYKDLFLPAELIQSIATVADPTDKRIGSAIGKALFKEPSDHA